MSPQTRRRSAGSRSRGSATRASTRDDAQGSAYELPEPELVVITHPDARVRVSDERGVTAGAADMTDVNALFRGSRATLRPLFGVSEERLSLAATAPSLLGIPVPDLSVYYRAEAPAGQLEKLADELRGRDVVVAAYIKPPAEPAAINDWAPSPDRPPATTPDYTSRQGYLDAAPGGIDARYAWTQTGGTGVGVRIIDIEGAWRFSHEDLLQNQGGVIGGTQSTDIGWRNHGTAVVGEFGGDPNGFGITGIAPDANVRAVSIFGGVGSAGALRLAADALGPGDIILIELHRPGPRHAFANRADQLGYIAIEWWPDDFDAIRYAIGRGVIVVEAAGNGAENLDDAIYNTPAAGFPAGWMNPFNRSNRDSGVILVGAGAPPPGTHGRDHGPDRSRLDFSNFGSAIDAQGWGREVTTTGYGDLQGGTNEDIWYTDRFSGTSSASPIVVGAVACLQGIGRARGSVLTNLQMRQHLRATGSPQQDAPGRPTSQRIANRPDLRGLVSTAFKTFVVEKFDPDKLRIKENLKREKIEKVEVKEQKREKVEIKEQLKREKIESKEKIEAKEKVEIKEGKELDEKRFVREKIEEGQIILQRDRILGGGVGGGLGGGFGGGFGGGITPGTGGFEAVGERLDRLESLVGELVHFIGGELRPDLGGGALSREPDFGEGGGKVDKETEKMSDG